MIINGMWTKYTACDLQLMGHHMTELWFMVITAYFSRMCNWNRVFDLTRRHHICA